MGNETDKHIQQLHKKAKALLKEDKEEEEVIEALVKEGIEPGYATLILNNVLCDERDRRDAWKLTLMSVFFIAGGLYINYSSYTIAVNNNAGFFYVFWGIVVVGIGMLVRAFFLFRK